jgi:predicted phosphate transport protein (TIGR00153 family)
MKNKLFNRLMPEEIRFFPLLNELAEITDEAARLLTACVSSSAAEQCGEIYREIKLKEQAADRVSQRIFNELNTTFITPFDREDIHALTDCIENITDAIHSAAKKIILYRPKQIPTEAVELSHFVGKATALIRDVVPLLESLHRNAACITRTCEKLHTIENQADEAYEKYTTQLFDHEDNVKELIKLKEISAKLESATDITDKVGKALRTIIVKHS